MDDNPELEKADNSKYIELISVVRLVVGVNFWRPIIKLVARVTKSEELLRSTKSEAKSAETEVLLKELSTHSLTVLKSQSISELTVLSQSIPKIIE